MRIVEVKVNRYRNIVEENTVKFGDITAFVGVNESGKSTLLQAVEQLNPYNKPVTLNTSRDYPRNLLRSEQKSGALVTEPVQASFVFNESERAELVKETGLVIQEPFVVTRGYDQKSNVKFTLKEKETAEFSLQRLSTVLISALEDVSSLQKIREGLVDLASVSSGKRTPESEAARKALVQNVIPDEVLVRKWVSEYVLAKLPLFVYLGEYTQLPGEADLTPVLAALKNDGVVNLTGGDKSVAALMRLAGVDADGLDNDYEEEIHELEHAAAALTNELHRYWHQDEHLSLQATIDRNTLNPGSLARSNWLRLRVRDDRTGLTGNLMEHSTGFRWFVSFLANSRDVARNRESANRDVVFLLDEPGLTLHPRAQNDLLKFMRETLALSHQVMYTTHSPFMLDVSRLNEIYTLEDTGKGAQVKTILQTKGQDTLQPLQGALGYQMMQNLYTSKNTLAVESLSDYLYLSVMSRYLETLNRTSLDTRWQVLPVGGAANMLALPSLLQGAQNYTILHGGSKTVDKVQVLVEAGLLERDRVIAPQDAGAVVQGGVEDLFDTGDYLKLYTAAHRTGPLKPYLQPSLPVLEQLGESGEANQLLTADYLLRNQEEVLSSLEEGTLQRFEDLFALINSRM